MAQWDAKDKTFLITGAASGMGAGFAESFLRHGAKNVAILDIAEELGAATAERLNAAHGNKAVFIKCDVSKEEDIARAFDAVLAHFKQIDVIINNAGVMVDAPDMWRTATDVNYQGVVSFTLKGVQHMRKDEGGAGGTIINISSIAALTRTPFVPIYKGSKLAVLHFSQSLAMDPFYEDTGIRVLTICFGATDTAIVQNLESRSYHPKLGKMLAAAVGTDYVCQKVESAVTALVEMSKIGAPGTIWLSVDNKPVREITPVIDSAFKDFENLLK
ncbi:hypothetical protein PYW07_002719 [Mythimna separata]|uniref:15-hydroxyprostaglandin dehydrogenase [NAD(+)]-like n=1 Tax=Mythimna separata TaxID=271217 RepID=A0AAD7YGE3_MYTSE|nr:hypothetical protein PYW07_002719 [Mythimna separata]